eukprot:scaffold2910_cov390-Prasinococcus_capsulatus_cf.AAC.33
MTAPHRSRQQSKTLGKGALQALVRPIPARNFSEFAYILGVAQPAVASSGIGSLRCYTQARSSRTLYERVRRYDHVASTILNLCRPLASLVNVGSCPSIWECAVTLSSDFGPA